MAGNVRIIENLRNAGFGEAINQGIQASTAPYLACLNDDAAPDPEWLDALVSAIESRPEIGMCASQVRLFGEDRIDSAGMLVCRDGSSKQRGNGRPPEDFPVTEEALLPSGSAALYRRAMLRRHRRLRRQLFSLLRRYRPGFARAMGRVEMPLCSRKP